MKQDNGKVAPAVFVTKLGTAKKVERSRIWIEGKRLVDAGFTVGQYFSKTWLGPNEPSPFKAPSNSLILELLVEDDVLNAPPCKVSGKGDKPIIDITGERVREHFGEFTHVECTFSVGKNGRKTIWIRGAE